MSQENVDLVVGIFQAVNRRDFNSPLESLAEDTTLKLHGNLQAGIGAGAMGKDAVARWYADWFSRFGDDYRFAVNETRDLGDRVFLVATHHATGRASGVPVEQQTAYLYTIRRGQVSHVEMWTDREEALKAVGLSE
jgi:ketosteroid isomerase-like protein